MFNNVFFRIRAVYEIKWKNIAQSGGPQMTIWRMRIARWITKATDTISEYYKGLLFQCYVGCTNVPQCHVIGTLPVLFELHTCILRPANSAKCTEVFVHVQRLLTFAPF